MFVLSRFSVSSLIFGALAVSAFACGSSKNKQVGVPTPAAGTGTGTTGLANGATGSNCKSKKDCPPIEADTAISVAPNGSLIGIVGKPVAWDFYGVDLKSRNPDGLSSVRKVTVLLDKVPEGSVINPEVGKPLAQHTKIEWTPTKEQKGVVDVIVRDDERCRMMEEDQTKCDKYAFHKDYDKKFPDRTWEVVSEETINNAVANEGAEPAAASDNVVQVSDPNCGPPPTTNADINGKLMSTFMQALQPGGLTAIVPSLIGGMAGGGGTAQPNPTEC